jgi:hypothetical protein
MLVIKPKYIKKQKKLVTVTTELPAEPEQKKRKLDSLINGEGIVYN